MKRKRLYYTIKNKMELWRILNNDPSVRHFCDGGCYYKYRHCSQISEAFEEFFGVVSSHFNGYCPIPLLDKSLIETLQRIVDMKNSNRGKR